MADYERNPATIIRIYQILKKYSDIDHPLKQQDIIDKLDSDYGMQMERKAIKRNLTVLESADICIEYKKTGGCYLAEREFSDEELRLLIDSVLSSKHISAKQSKKLIDKLIDQANVFFKNSVKHVITVNDWGHTDNEALFYNIELIDEAINEKKQLGYEYNKYGIDKKLHKTSYQYVSPYQLIVHNQRYYLMAYSDFWKNIVFHRIDHITNMAISDKKAIPLRELKGYAGGIDYKKFNSQMPYMYSDDPMYIDFIVDAGIIDQVIDWFGQDASISPIKGGESKVKVMVKCSPMAMKNWALQYADYVEITSPSSLRKEIKESLAAAYEKYSK